MDHVAAASSCCHLLGAAGGKELRIGSPHPAAPARVSPARPPPLLCRHCGFQSVQMPFGLRVFEA